MKKIMLDLDDETHNALKVLCVKQGVAMKLYIAELVKKSVKLNATVLDKNT